MPELKALGVTDAELGLERLTETTQRILGTSKTVWLLGYRIRLGVK